VIVRHQTAPGSPIRRQAPLRGKDCAVVRNKGRGPGLPSLSRLPYLDIQGPNQDASKDFEESCSELAIIVEGLGPSTIALGRKGQKQFGLDIFGCGRHGQSVGAQCKLEQDPGTPADCARARDATTRTQTAVGVTGKRRCPGRDLNPYDLSVWGV
jgi:hypothetical protein